MNTFIENLFISKMHLIIATASLGLPDYPKSFIMYFMGKIVDGDYVPIMKLTTLYLIRNEYV